MRLSLKTKFTLATSLLVLVVVTVVSGLYLGRLTRQTLRQANDRAGFVAHQLFSGCTNALADAAERGEAPASTEARGSARVRPASLRQQQHAEFADRIGGRIFADDLRNHDHRPRRRGARVERRIAARPEEWRRGRAWTRWCVPVSSSRFARCMVRLKRTNTRCPSCVGPRRLAIFASDFPRH